MANHVDAVDASWIVVPLFLSIIVYLAIVLFTWPYARPLMPLWLVLLAILFPPAFPFLILFVLVRILCYPVVPLSPDAIVVIDTARARPRLVHDPRVRRGSSAP